MCVIYSVLGYNVKLNFRSAEEENIYSNTLESQRFTYNECSKLHFGAKSNSLVGLHNKFYKPFREKYPEIPSNVVIHTIQEVLSSYRSIKSNNHRITKPPEKKNLSIRLTKNTATLKVHLSTISLTAIGGKRVKATFISYPKLQELINKYPICDPLIFKRDGQIWLSLVFNTPEIVPKNKLAVGVDLGICNFAATSEGNLYQDKKFTGRKRALRFNKRKLLSKADTGSKSARRKLKKLRRKEHNANQNFSHHLANKIISGTTADTLVLEDLKSLKVKKHRYQNKNRISQVPMYELRRILTYKAPLAGKTVIVVSPAYTSQIDHRTGKKDGLRSGGRYIGKDGQLLHADCNAACNIALRSKLPCSISNYYAWQAKVNSPIVGFGSLQASTVLA